MCALPKCAELIDAVNHPHFGRVNRYSAMLSDGYKSEYERHRVDFLEWIPADGKRRKVLRHSGAKNLAYCDRTFSQLRRFIQLVNGGMAVDQARQAALLPA